MNKQDKPQVKIGTISLNYPWMIASGILGTSASLINRLSNCRLGAIITKSVGPEPRSGYTNPTVIAFSGDLSGTVLNAVGLSNPGVDAFASELMEIKSPKTPIIVSIFGATSEEIAIVTQKLENAPISGYEINLSCPHGGKYGLALGTSPDIVHKVISATKNETKKPVWAKLTPNVTNIVDIGLAAEEAGADAIVAVNTIQAVAVDIWTRKLILSHGIGGLSGASLRPIAQRCVVQLRRALGIPIIGVGGIQSWENVVEYLILGANAVQIGSALINKSPEKFFEELSLGFEGYLEKEGFSHIHELVGIALG